MRFPTTSSSTTLARDAAALALAVTTTLGAGCNPAGLAARGAEGTSRSSVETARVHGVDISVWSGRVTDAEMECFWDHGVRHVIVGTQEIGIARQQMEMAIEHGMTVDAYVYLMWDRDMRRQVEDALAFARSYPVGMLWLDIEQDPAGLGREALEDRIQTAAEACGDFPCGVYTGGWWWNAHMASSRIVEDLPLWYANYDGDPSIETYPSQRVGTWASPWGKQYAGDLDLCGIDVDLNTIRVTTTPSRAHVGLPAPTAGLPAAPTGLSPTGYERVPGWMSARVLSRTIPGATRYDFEIESWNGARYATYYTYTSTTNAREFSPRNANTTYRFRVRATNGAGTGAWSAWSYFEYGTVASRPPEPGTTTPPPSEPPPSEPPPSEPPPSEPPPSEPPPSEPPPATGSFGAPSPADGARVTGSAITMTRGAIAGTGSYSFEIQYDAGGTYAHYYDYAGSSATRTFYPAYANTAYRWRVRADAGAWSAWSVVLFGASATAPGASPPPGEPPPSEPPPSEPPPAVPGAPTNLTPSGGAVSTPAVTLRCDPVTGASSYELAIEVRSGASFGAYYTYTSSTSSKTFYPSTHGTAYRFRVRARTAAGWGPWSSYAQFDYL
jgi:GH25 family lysozyme M1 (1,4-beta-N-acetylmuramidase)